MSFILVIGGLFTVNMILIRNCSIFVSVKVYPLICNYSLFKKMNGKMEFTREVPTALGGPVNFENNRRKSLEKKNKRLRDKKNEHELEVLNKKSNGLEVVVHKN